MQESAYIASQGMYTCAQLGTDMSTSATAVFNDDI